MGLQPASFPPRGGWANPIQPCQRLSRCLLMNRGEKTTYCAPGDLLVILLGDLSCNPRVSWLSPEPGVKRGSYALRQPPPGVSVTSTAKTPWKVAPTLPWSFCDSTDVYAQALLYRGWESNQNLARWLMDWGTRLPEKGTQLQPQGFFLPTWELMQQLGWQRNH